MPIYTYKSKDGKHTKEILVSKVMSSDEDPGQDVEIDGEVVHLDRDKSPSVGGKMKMNWSYWNMGKNF